MRDLRALDGDALVTGSTAGHLDLQDSLVDHLPLVLAIVVVVTMVVLFVMTGSVILPIKQVLMNALGLSAVFGILVLIFQDGRFEGLLGYTSQGGLESTQPLLLFAVVFGLSTDYGVFLLSRIKEARDAGHSDSEAVAVGLERTGRIVTAAALLFCIAIGAFVTSQIVFIKELGLGTAIAVLIDATIIRALLVPALMQLLGKWNWWAPGAAGAAARPHRLAGSVTRNGVVYQIYPRSFQDSDGDGVGDLAGIRARLDHLVWLGVDALWMSPIYPSPNADFGYDVSDYTDVDPVFGDLAEFDALAEAAHERGLERADGHRALPHLDRAPLVPRAPGLVHLGRPAQQLGDRLRRLGLGAARRPLLPALVLSRAARPRLAQPGGRRRDAGRAALLARARRGRLPRRRDRPAAEGPAAARRPARRRSRSACR